LTEDVDAFNALPAAEAEAGLYECLASRVWAARVAAGRPYESVADLLREADAAWAAMNDADWLQAFAAHPRIGERGGAAAAFSEREQGEVMEAPAATLGALAVENRAYEERFGHVFLIAAAGRGAGEILAELRRRMGNDAASELQEAVGEQRKITRARLRQLVTRAG
jgi:OHCU decarboxylase